MKNLHLYPLKDCLINIFSFLEPSLKNRANYQQVCTIFKDVVDNHLLPDILKDYRNFRILSRDQVLYLAMLCKNNLKCLDLTNRDIKLSETSLSIEKCKALSTLILPNTTYRYFSISYSDNGSVKPLLMLDIIGPSIPSLYNLKNVTFNGIVFDRDKYYVIDDSNSFGSNTSEMIDDDLDILDSNIYEMINDEDDLNDYDPHISEMIDMIDNKLIPYRNSLGAISNELLVVEDDPKNLFYDLTNQTKREGIKYLMVKLEEDSSEFLNSILLEEKYKYPNLSGISFLGDHLDRNRSDYFDEIIRVFNIGSTYKLKHLSLPPLSMEELNAISTSNILQTIENLEIYIVREEWDIFNTDWEEDILISILNDIGELPNIKSLVIQGKFFDENMFDTKKIEKLYKKLEKFKLIFSHKDFDRNEKNFNHLINDYGRFKNDLSHKDFQDIFEKKFSPESTNWLSVVGKLSKQFPSLFFDIVIEKMEFDENRIILDNPNPQVLFEYKGNYADNSSQLKKRKFDPDDFLNDKV